ncbi:ATP-binding cassette domain-containing protein [Pusillimonas sp. TS35]|uniref:ABC transporter ATP-binding protein n=1 Tax=Paracandidimonas lactea TaxID=2895524 RepID=UPI0013686F26|nr:ABC transporter ATP-binding protein [Paracandidimonas lactea]MYN13924.1 ATP-binding cassette domain-containing protein [Pusillimonas sp. TS35]
MLDVRNVVRRFGGLTAVNDVSMGVAENEIVALIGPNGAGKTTLFNLIAGVLPVDQGAITFNGCHISGLGSARISRLGLARTFQIPQLFASMTALETAMIGALTRTRSIDEAGRNAAQVLDLVGLGDRKNDAASTLTISGKKRLEIARALATRPSMILLDEVMAGLNQPEVHRLLDLIRKLREGGMTVLLVEHNIEAVLNVADRIVVLDQGKKIADGPPRQVLGEKDVIGAYLGEAYAFA